MNIFVPFTIFLVLAPAVFFMNLESESFEDLQHNNDSTLFVGEGEICRGGNIKAKCLEGFSCALISTYPKVNGVCVKNEEKDFFDENIDNLDEFNYSVN